METHDAENGKHGAPVERSMRDPVRILVAAERTLFLIVGVFFYAAALAVVVRAAPELWTLVSGARAGVIPVATTFLDLMLLALMLVELAYTVILSLRGAVLVAEPFLLVGLIAVIRRLIVITIGDVKPAGAVGHEVAGPAGAQPIELGILTGIVLVLVVSIAILRARPRHDTGAKAQSAG